MLIILHKHFFAVLKKSRKTKFLSKEFISLNFLSYLNKARNDWDKA